ncbi:MAG: hypothetical protein ABIN35_00785 [candidate division WOR-3 bacterium]
MASAPVVAAAAAAPLDSDLPCQDINDYLIRADHRFVNMVPEHKIVYTLNFGEYKFVNTLTNYNNNIHEHAMSKNNLLFIAKGIHLMLNAILGQPEVQQDKDFSDIMKQKMDFNMILIKSFTSNTRRINDLSDLIRELIDCIKRKSYMIEPIFQFILTIFPHHFDSKSKKTMSFQTYHSEDKGVEGPYIGFFDQHFNDETLQYFTSEHHVDDLTLINPKITNSLYRTMNVDNEISYNRDNDFFIDIKSAPCLDILMFYAQSDVYVISADETQEIRQRVKQKSLSGEHLLILNLNMPVIVLHFDLLNTQTHPNTKSSFKYSMIRQLMHSLNNRRNCFNDHIIYQATIGTYIRGRVKDHEKINPKDAYDLIHKTLVMWYNQANSH